MADGPAGFTQGSTCPALLRIPLGFMTLRVRDCHPLRLLFPEHSTRVNLATSRSYYPEGAGTPAVWAAPRSLATTWGITFCFLFLPVLRCFSSRGSLPHLVRVTVRQTAGLPHSEIRGSRVACTYPRLIAACRVLRRLPEPRHPPYALSYFRRANCLAPLREQLAHAFSLPLAWTASRIRFLFVYSTFLLGFINQSRLLPCGHRRSSFLNQFLFLFQHVKDRRASALSCGCGFVENNGFEPLTPCVQSRCSSQLS